MGARLQFDWHMIRHDLNERGWSKLGGLLDVHLCGELIDTYADSSRFYKTVNMERHGFGKGEYKYLDHPLPESITARRDALYPPLADIANEWNAQVGNDFEYPNSFRQYESVCREFEQTRPTPLLLRYETGGYNCLHQDLYGDAVFPFQLTVMLSRPGIDFTGGEFVLTEQRPRRQSRVEVIHLARGEAVVFPVQWRPIKGTRGYYRAKLRHGVSTISSGVRYAAGIIFHGAK